MAIIIPSKNIYSMNNPKVRDNVVDNVSVGHTIVTPKNEYETPIYSVDIETNNLIQKYIDNYDIRDDTRYNNDTGAISLISFVSYADHKFSEVEIEFPVIYDNKYQIPLLGLDKNQNPWIKYNIYGTTEKYSASAKWDASYSYSGNSTSIRITRGEISYNPLPSDERPSNLQIPTEISNPVDDDRGLGLILYANAEEKLNDTIDWAQVKYSVIQKNGIEYYKYNLSFLTSVRVVKLSGTFNSISEYNGEKLQLRGTSELYEPQQITVTIYGNTIGIDLTDGSITYGGGDKPFSLSGNEILQSNCTTIALYNANVTVVKALGVSSTTGNVALEINSIEYLLEDTHIYYQGEKATVIQYNSFTKVAQIDCIYNGKFHNSIGKDINIELESFTKLTHNLANNILSQYAKGKETATIRCSISDYYDESGAKVIDTKSDRMSFHLHDQVIPMVYGYDGNDRTMSKYQDGSRKVFEVVGSNIFYDGAVWQELTLQEVLQSQ